MDDERGDGMSHSDDPDGESAFVSVIICEPDAMSSDSVMSPASRKPREFVVWIKLSRSWSDSSSSRVAWGKGGGGVAEGAR